VQISLEPLLYIITVYNNSKLRVLSELRKEIQIEVYLLYHMLQILYYQTQGKASAKFMWTRPHNPQITEKPYMVISQRVFNLILQFYNKQSILVCINI